MALPDCVDCTCIPPNIPNDKFKQDVEKLLCNIITALTGGGGDALATYAEGSVAGAAGGVPTTGVSVLANTAHGLILTVLNTLDVIVLVSTDGGVTYPFPVPANNGTAVIDFGANGKYFGAAIFAKAVGSNSTSGTLYAAIVK